MVRECSTGNRDSGDIRKTVLILIWHYLPGFKAGGILRSVVALVEGLKDEFKFKIVCGDRDLGDRQPFAGEPIGSWYEYGPAEVLRVPPGLAGARMLIRVLRQEGYDVLYVNGVLHREFSMLPLACRRAGLLPRRPTVLAPRGEFSMGALSIKSKRKLLYIKLSTWIGFYRGIIWHASTILEEADIRRSIANLPAINSAGFLPGGPRTPGVGTMGIIAVAQDMHQMSACESGTRLQKRAGRLRVLFVSRISPKKNLLCALKMLQGLSGDVCFDIYGPAEDAEYWSSCKQVIGTMPPNVRVEYMGVIEHEKVGEVFAGHDLFLFPTLGENYGHVICEALIAGCPVLISDRTPWHNLQKEGAGWDIPLDEPERFHAALQQCVDADEEWYGRLVARAAAYGRMAASDPAVIEENRRMLRFAACVASEA